MVTKIIDNTDLLKRLARSEETNFNSVSATDYRYQVKELLPYFSEEAFIWYKAAVETGIVKAFSDIGTVPKNSVREIRSAAQLVNAKEVYEEEGRTHHDIIALVNEIKEMVTDQSKTAVHRSATSFDTIDTANAARYRDAFSEVIIPDTAKLLRSWIGIVRRESMTLQIGRTHLQHGEPVTFGFSMAWFADRLGGRLIKLKNASDSVVGKFSGAMGAYNAASLFVPSPVEFEKKVLGNLDLKPASISTQIVQPEFVDDLVHYTISSFGVIANWAHDMRNLMRPELSEVWLPRSKDVSRSSTMPHKANPVGFENVQSLWKEVIPRIITMYMDQLSENGRDLTNSASQRYTPEIFDLYDFAVRRARGMADNLQVNKESMLKNFKMSENVITAEPLQLLLSSHGRHTAHSEVGKLADKAMSENVSVVELARKDPDLSPYMEMLTEEQNEMLSNPEEYTGKASAKAIEIADKWDNKLTELGL